jgi:uncharacterized protein YecE (DUF72 family)
METKIGTCGFGLAQRDYASVFSCVEVQHTFYQPPRVATLERWRNQVPSSFEFALKAWQLITHDAKSPTYRRLKRPLSQAERDEAGYFRDTEIVKEAWLTTLASARALQAKAILFQCPASFVSSKQNISRLEKFFSSINREGLDFYWEPRGDWDGDVIRSICADLDLAHVVDPFVAQSVTPDWIYFRLHGRGGWRYRYEDDELRELAAKVSANRRGYIFFNNSSMTDDAIRFKQYLTPSP